MAQQMCCLIRDLLPLYVDELVSSESKAEIFKHINECETCKDYYENMVGETPIEVPIPVDEIEDQGRVIVSKIKKNQNRIKYTLIIFSMIVAVCTTFLSSGFVSTIPLIILVPFVLNILFREGKIVFITALFAHFIITFGVGNGFAYCVVTLPLTLICVCGGAWLGSCVKTLIEGGGSYEN